MSFAKLKIKIKTDTGLDITNLRRNYASIHMRASGAWCWKGDYYLTESSLTPHEIGSSLTVKELLKAEKLYYRLDSWNGGYEIIDFKPNI